MTNPSQAWEQAQERHITQVRGVVWTLREASRVAKIPGEDQNGFSKRAIEEGRRAFFRAVDSIKFGKEANETNKPNFVHTGVKLEDDKGIEMEIWPMDTRSDATGARLENTVINNGSEQVQNNNCHMNDSDRNKSVSKTTHHITKPELNISNGGSTVTSGGTSANIAQTGPHDSSAMQQQPEVTDLVSSHEPQISSSSSGLFIKGGSRLEFPQTCTAQVATLRPDKALATEGPIERPGILQPISAIEKRLAEYKGTAQVDGFDDHDHFADIWNADAGEVLAGLSKPIIARCVSGEPAVPSKRKLSDAEAAGQGQKDRDPKMLKSDVGSYERSGGLEDNSDELWVVSRDEFISSQLEQVPDSSTLSHEASDDEQEDSRTDQLRCKSMQDFMDWIRTLKSQAMHDYNGVIDDVKKICAAESRLSTERFPNWMVLEDLLETVQSYGHDVHDATSWQEWQDELTDVYMDYEGF